MFCIHIIFAITQTQDAGRIPGPSSFVWSLRTRTDMSSGLQLGHRKELYFRWLQDWYHHCWSCHTRAIDESSLAWSFCWDFNRGIGFQSQIKHQMWPVPHQSDINPEPTGSSSTHQPCTIDRESCKAMRTAESSTHHGGHVGVRCASVGSSSGSQRSEVRWAQSVPGTANISHS